jgi:hypothetical protein
MATIAYHKAFSIELRHEYFTDEFAVNEKLELIPTASCEQLLAHGRMVFRKTGKGALVMYRSENPVPGTPTVQLSGSQVFNFKLKLKEVTQFMNVTELDLSGTYNPARPVFLKSVVNGVVSANTPTQLTVEFLDGYRPSRFAETYLLTGGNNTLQVTDITGTIVSSQIINSNIAVQKQLSVDLSGFAPGYYTVTFTDSLAAATTRKYYVGDDIVPGESLAMLGIAYTASQITQLYDDSAIFEYQFLAKEVQWRYYLLPRFIESTYYSLANKPIISVALLDPAAPALLFTATNSSQPDTSISISGIHPIVFESDQQIALREEKQYQIKLLNNSPAHVITDFLPHPDLQLPLSDSAVYEVFFYIDRLMIPV